MCRRQKKADQMLKQVQHDKMVWFRSCCHPEPGPELISGSSDFGISILDLENLGLKSQPYGQSTLLGKIWAKFFS
jgi:hypothetical protein